MDKMFLSVGNQRVYYQKAGDPRKPVLVCLHGLTGSSESFIELSERLESDFHLFMFDQPGHGQTHPLPHDYLFSTLTGYYKTIFDRLIGFLFTWAFMGRGYCTALCLSFSPICKRIDLVGRRIYISSLSRGHDL